MVFTVTLCMKIRTLTNERSLGDHVVEDIEGLGVSAKHQGAAHHVQAVDRQRLSRDQTENEPMRGQLYGHEPIRGQHYLWVSTRCLTAS